MTDHTAKNIILKDSNGEYLIPYTIKQEPLVSGQNIKTINGNSILGSGNLTIEAIDESSRQLFDGVYAGENLNNKFATEIAAAGDIWDFLHARAQAGNYEGIHIGDYFTFTTNQGTVKGIHTDTSNPVPTSVSIPAQTRTGYIMGLDVYTSSGDTAIGHEIAVWAGFGDHYCQWNPTNNNNGTSTNPEAWLACKLKAVLNGENNLSSNKIGATGCDALNAGYLQLFPSKARGYMVTKRAFVGTRYSSTAALTDSAVGTRWIDMGKLWAPTEMEVYGCMIHSIKNTFPQTEGYYLNRQYPLFRMGQKFGMLRFGRVHWWLSSPTSGASTLACSVHAFGTSYCTSTTFAYVRAPLCFNIG